MKLIIFLISFHFQWAIAQELSNHVIADANSTYHVFWSVDGENITFEVQVATKGYVGFGFSPNGGMPGSDIVIGWVLPNGQVYFQDRHALGFYEPLIDSEQNYNLLNAFENETHTVFRFARKLNTCDKENDTVITDSTMKIIYSWHPDDPQDLTGFQYHGQDRRGAKNILLLSSQPPPTEITDDITIWDMQMPNVTIPAQITTYWCIRTKLPPLSQPHNYIGSTILITPGNENIVHHSTVQECRGNISDNEEKYEQQKNGYDCSPSQGLDEPKECERVVFGWSAGSPGHYYPKDVGRILGEEYGGPSYFLIKMHYNNVDKKEGIADSTTIRAYLSKKHMINQVGRVLMSAKFDYTLIIPPRQPSFKISTYIPSECTSNAFPEEGITLFGLGGHAHLLGRKYSIRHFRDNKELKPIVEEENYDFDYQEIRQLPETVRIMRNDMLLGTCVYSTMDQTETVVGGFGTADEMCVFNLYYYPKVELVESSGQPSFVDILNYFEVEEIAQDHVHIISPASLQNQSIIDVIRHYDWNTVEDTKLKEMVSMQYDGVRSVTCRSDVAINQMVQNVAVGYPNNIPTYIPPPDVCDISNSTA